MVTARKAGKSTRWLGLRPARNREHFALREIHQSVGRNQSIARNSQSPEVHGHASVGLHTSTQKAKPSVRRHGRVGQRLKPEYVRSKYPDDHTALEGGNQVTQRLGDFTLAPRSPGHVHVGT